MAEEIQQERCKASSSTPCSRIPDAQVEAWLDRHDLWGSFGGDEISSARAAMEDAATIEIPENESGHPATTPNQEKDDEK